MNIEAGRTHYIGEFKLTLDAPLTYKKTVPGGTAIHEAKHVVAALQNGTSVESVTIIPGAGYLGLTKLSRPDAVAALAPHATGESGTSYDVFIASQIGAAGAESAARSIINGNMEKVEAVAQALEENKSLGSGDINRTIYKLDHPDPEFATLVIQSPDGERVEKKVEVRDNIIVADGLVEIFSAKKAPMIH